MQTELNQISPVVVELKVEVPWDRVSVHLERTYKEIAKHAQVRGFRRGKVPRHILQKVYGDRVREEVASLVIEDGLVHAVEEHELLVVAQPNVEPPSIKKNAPCAFTATLEVRPKIEKVSFKKLDVEVERVDVTDEQIDERINALRERSVTIQEPEKARASKAGDELTIDYSVSVDGETIEELTSEAKEVVLGEGLLPEFDAGLQGVNVGDEVEIGVDFEEDAGHPALKGKHATFTVKVSKIMERILPEIDDDFADEHEYESLAAMKEAIRGELDEAANRERETRLKVALIDSLIAKNEVPVPPTMLEDQRKEMLQQMLTFSQMLGQQVTPEDLESVGPRAERRVKAGLLLSALARQEKLEVTDADIDTKLGEMAEKTGKHIAKLKADYQGERREQLENELLEEKLLTLVKESAKIREVEPKADAEEE